MKKLLLLGISIGLLRPVSAFAENVFDGTWKYNLEAELSKKPDIYLFQDGMYHCKTCVPVVDIKADGHDQPVKGSPYYDSASIKIVDDRTIEEIDRKNGKVVASSKTVLSSDGKTAKVDSTDSSNSSGAAVSSSWTITQVAKGPAGSHALSGSWVTSKIDSFSDNGRTFTFKVDGDRLSMTNLVGQSYVAKMDGTDAPFKGDPGVTSVSVKSTGANSIELSNKRDGKVISVVRMTVNADRKTMTVKLEDKLLGINSQFTAAKQ